MKQNILKLINIIAYPIRKEPALFIFLYLLGIISIYYISEIPYLPYYLKLYGELFFDTYCVCLLVSLMPKKLHAPVLGMTYFIAYIGALIDTFCFVRLGTTISPTIIQLILETNSKEATGFFSTYIETWGGEYNIFSRRYYFTFALHKYACLHFRFLEKCKPNYFPTNKI